MRLIERILSMSVVFFALGPMVTFATTLPRIDRMPVFRERLNAYLKTPGVVAAEAYFSTIDDYVTSALDLGWTVEQVNDQIRALSDLDSTMPWPSYRLTRLLTSNRILYFAEYRISSWAGSTIRILQSSSGHFKVTFKFTPLACKELKLEEFVSIDQLLWTGHDVLLVALCGGEMSGFAPPASLFVWKYDPDTMLATERFRLLHRDGLVASPIESGDEDLVVEYRPEVDGEPDRAVSYRDTYDLYHNGTMVRRECISNCAQQ